jgi:putative methyltransferase (TIGR04325 family)
VLVLGGSVGVSWYALSPYLSRAERLAWQVCELPETAALGRKIATEREAAQLSFTTEPRAMDGADVLFSAGTIQYIDTPLVNMLAPLALPPRHVLINRLPLTGGRSFITLQNSGVAVSPYRIQNEDGFLGGMDRLGYRVVDRWKCLQNSAAIPLHPEHTLEHFHGFYFAR